MSTIHWFRADEGGLQGHGREDYVYIRGWAVDQGPTLFHASCMSSSGKAEGRVQAGRASERGDEVSYRMPHGPSNYYNSRLTGQMLANEVASALDEPQRWRDYAGWLWHRRDGRARRIELGEALEAASLPNHRAHLLEQIREYDQQYWANYFAELEQIIAEVPRRSSRRGPALRRRHGQLVALRGWPRKGMLEWSGAPVVLGELELELSSVSDLDQLDELLAEVPGLTHLRLDTQVVIDVERTASLLSSCWRRLPRLRKLEVRALAGTGAGMCINHECMQWLALLLRRQRAPICGLPLRRLELDLIGPRQGWSSAAVDELCRALAYSELDELVLLGAGLPAELHAWIEASELRRRLVECRVGASTSPTRLISQVRAGEIVVEAPASAPAIDEADPASVLVWADWLQSHGDPVGELATLRLLGGDAVDEQVVRLRGHIEVQFAGGYPDALQLSWRDALIEAIVLRGAACPDPRALLGRLLRHPAAVELRTLTIERSWGWSVERLLDPKALGLVGAESPLAKLERFELDSESAPALAVLLARLPKLRELVLRTPGWRLTSPCAHTQLHTLALSLPATLGRRPLARALANLAASELPGLQRLRIDFEPGREGPPLSTDPLLELPRQVDLVASGALRWCDAEQLRRFGRRRGRAVEIVASILQ